MLLYSGRKKMGIQKNTFLGLICIVSMLTLAACSSTGVKEGENVKAPTSSNIKTISIGTSSAPPGFNPIDNTQGFDLDVLSVLFPPLVSLDDSMKFVPRLAD